jgi:hypothetical protein
MQSEREIAFWVQFAEVWNGLAIVSISPKREDYIAKAAECLALARLIQERTSIDVATNPVVNGSVRGGAEASKNPSSDPEPSIFAR